jgi:hypothetical protein
MTPLRQRLIEDMRVRNYAPQSTVFYSGAIRMRAIVKCRCIDRRDVDLLAIRELM